MMKFHKFVEVKQYALRYKYYKLSEKYRSHYTFKEFVRDEYIRYRRTSFMTRYE